MPVSPILEANGPVIISIKSGGKPIPDTIGVLSIRTETSVNRIPKAILTLRDGDVASNKFPATDSDLFKPGAKIEVLAGYGDGKLAQIFKGVVVANRLRISGALPSHIEVTCHDEVFKLTLGRRNRVFEDKKDSAILASIAKDSGIKLTMKATSETFTDLVQYRCSDWDFIIARAEFNGMIVNVTAGEISIAPPDFSTSPALEVTYGTDVYSFDAQLDARSQYKNVKAWGWNSDTQEDVTENEGTGTANKWGNLKGSDLASVGNREALFIDNHTKYGLKEIVKARQMRAELARIIGTVKFSGSATVELGKTLKLKGFGDRFSGTGLISRICHNLEDGAWATEVGLGLKETLSTDKSGVEAPGAAGSLAPTRGLHIGKVTKLAEESTSQKLIQVKLPGLGDVAAPIWCRLGTPYATNNAGILFLPEIDDEVVVGFFNDDPSAGVVLGALHSAKLVPPLEAEDPNNIKTIVTREQLKMSFDEEKKCITIETPGANKVTIDDDSKSIKIEDEHGNSVLLSSSGITLDSPKDIKISAGGEIDISAKKDIKMSGANIKAKAQMAFSAEGGASAELKASGTVTVQGALVKIN